MNFVIFAYKNRTSRQYIQYELIRWLNQVYKCQSILQYQLNLIFVINITNQLSAL